MVARDALGQDRCTHSNHADAFHLRVVNERVTFATLSVAIPAADGRNAYWMDTGARMHALLGAGTHTYELTLSLVESRRASARRGQRSPLQRWLESSVCMWHVVPLGAWRSVIVHEALAAATEEHLPACATLPRANESAYVRLDATDATGGCGHRWCIGNATSRLLDTANSVRQLARSRQGFRHVLRSTGCRLRLYGERRLSRCLQGRRVLLMGSSFNVDLRKGFARINATLRSWTRTPPGPAHPNVADFWRAFEKPSGTYCYRRGKCATRFGQGVVETALFHYPSWRPGGLANLRDEHYARMCAADVVVLESGRQDVSLPPTAAHPLAAGGSPLLRACAPSALPQRRPDPSDAAACALAVDAAVQNDSARSAPLAEYAARLSRLLEAWRACKARKPRWRAAFLLSGASRGAVRPGGGGRGAEGAAGAAAAPPRAPPVECGARFVRGMASHPHGVARLNEVARRMVEAAGFEVLDPLAVTLHALPSWYDKERRPMEFAPFEAEALSDVMTQAVVGQLCAGE